MTTDKDQPVTLDPLQNDKSPSGIPLDLVDVTDGENGTCVINEDGTVTYTPEAGYTGIDLCLYTVCDENELCDEGVSSGVTSSCNLLLAVFSHFASACKFIGYSCVSDRYK